MSKYATTDDNDKAVAGDGYINNGDADDNIAADGDEAAEQLQAKR